MDVNVLASALQRTARFAHPPAMMPPTTISDVETAFHRFGTTQNAHAEQQLCETLVAYTEAMKQNAIPSEQVVKSVRAAARSAVPHLSDARMTVLVKLCLDQYFRPRD